MKYDKAVAAVQAKLLPDETMVMWQKLSYENAKKALLQGALVLTQHRVIFVGSFMQQRADFSIPLDTITSVDSARGLANTYTTITSASASHRFLAVTPNFVNTINNARLAPRQPLATQTTSSVSTADELRKLASLRASGILTDAEFVAAKARLLA